MRSADTPPSKWWKKRRHSGKIITMLGQASGHTGGSLSADLVACLYFEMQVDPTADWSDRTVCFEQRPCGFGIIRCSGRGGIPTERIPYASWATLAKDIGYAEAGRSRSINGLSGTRVPGQWGWL